MTNPVSKNDRYNHNRKYVHKNYNRGHQRDYNYYGNSRMTQYNQKLKNDDERKPESVAKSKDEVVKTVQHNPHTTPIAVSAKSKDEVVKTV